MGLSFGGLYLKKKRMETCLVTPPWLPAGVAVDGPNKTSTDSNNNYIRLIKKKGKVKALDEELHSKFMRF